MSKTTEIQIEKSRNLIEGLRRHVREMGERGVPLERRVKVSVSSSIRSLRSQKDDKKPHDTYTSIMECCSKRRLTASKRSSAKTRSLITTTLHVSYPSNYWKTTARWRELSESWKMPTTFYPRETSARKKFWKKYRRTASLPSQMPSMVLCREP